MNSQLIQFRDRRLPESFWSKVVLNTSSGCWEWAAARNELGYGIYAVSREPRRAHRVAFSALVGPIPEGLDLDHLCRNAGCCNPAHLEPVTHRVNVLRGESPLAHLAKRTHCVEGHSLSGANLSPSSLRRGLRACLTCERRRAREQSALVRRAAHSLGLSIEQYKAAYGQGRAVALSILGGAAPEAVAS